MIGLVSVLLPLRFMGIMTRAAGAVIMLGGLVAVAVAMLWPVPSLTRVAQRQSLLDEVLPEYHFHERHEILVHAPPERIVAVWNKVTVGELGYAEQFMRIRRMAFGNFRRPPSLKAQSLSQTGVPGILLRQDAHEIVSGMAGSPWSGHAAGLPKNAEEFGRFSASNAVKIVFNMRVEDAGNGWSRLSTETRVLALDNSARHKMTPYWRVIYPGSSVMRSWWLDAIRRRAENQ